MTEPAGQAPQVAVGREAELSRIERFLEGFAGRSLAFMLEGEPGIGKTTLWNAGVAMARARHIEVLACRAVESEARLAFSALADLLQAVPEAAFSALPGPQRRALDAALLRAGPEDLRPDPRAVAAATLGTLRALARAGPVLVAIDDLPWLDRASAATLEFALRRLDAEPVGLLATARSEGALGSTQDGRVPPLSRIDRLVLGPLSLRAFGAYSMREVRGRGGGLRWCFCTRPVAGIRSSALSSRRQWRSAFASREPGRHSPSQAPSRTWRGRG
jgi:AAA ATPase domain